MSRSIVLAALGNYTYPLTRHSIAQVVIHNLHNLLNEFHKTGIDPGLKPFELSIPIKPDSRSFSLRSAQEHNQLTHDLKLSKPQHLWISRHNFHRTRTPFSVMKGSPESEAPAIKDELTLHLIKPRSLMNVLGPFVHDYHSSLLRSQPDTKLILLHDDLDLQPLVIRRRSPPKSLKPYGHNGLRSVLSAVPSPRHKLIHTIGIGIGRDPNNNSKDSSAVGNWVMSPLKRAEIEACSWVSEHSHSASPQYGTVVKEVWDNVRNLMRMP